MPELIYKSYNIWVCHSNLNNDLSKINTLHVCHTWSKNDNKEKLKKDKANFICRTDKISTEILWVMTHIKSWVLFLILNKIQCKYKWKIWTADELRKWWYLHTSYFVKKKFVHCYVFIEHFLLRHTVFLDWIDKVSYHIPTGILSQQLPHNIDIIFKEIISKRILILVMGL